MDGVEFRRPGAPASARKAGASRRAGRDPRRGRLAEALACAFVAALFTLCGAVFFASRLLNADGHTFYGNIAIDGVDVGGMTDGQVATLLAGREPPDTVLRVAIDGREWDVAARDAFVRYDAGETIAGALAVGREGGALERLGDVLALRAGKRAFRTAAVFDGARLARIVQRIAAEASKPPVDAALQFFPDAPEAFVYTAESAGKSVDPAELLSAIRGALGRGGAQRLAFESAPVKPDVTAAGLKARTQLLGSYATALTDEPARTNNILLAARAVNGAVISPGGTFSFNERTGERTKDKGYDEAPAISGGRLVDAPGGGVCQVSTTVYDAALLSGLGIAERHSHTWPMAYVPAGFDAMVDWNGKDLRIRNGSAAPVYLVFRVDTQSRLATAEFYGLPEADGVRLDTGGYEIVSPGSPVRLANAAKPVGWSRTVTESRNGCRVSVYRSTLRGGEERLELVSSDFYPPQRGEIEIGTQPPAEENK